MVKNTVEITKIEFVDSGQGGFKRTANVELRVIPQGGSPFIIPMSFDALPEEEGQVVAWAKAAFHLLTTRLSEQTKGWALP